MLQAINKCVNLFAKDALRLNRWKTDTRKYEKLVLEHVLGGLDEELLLFTNKND